MTATKSALSPAAYAVLGAVAEAPTHGFAIARRLHPDGDLGRVWSMPRSHVYRELSRLIERDLVRETVQEAGERGPRRTVMAATAAGRRETRRWLAEPVDRVRDFRSMFLLKLALLDRADLDAAPLIGAQRERFADRLDQLDLAVREGEGFEQRIALWRLVSTRAAMEFLDALR